MWHFLTQFETIWHCWHCLTQHKILTIFDNMEQWRNISTNWTMNIVIDMEEDLQEVSTNLNCNDPFSRRFQDHREPSQGKQETLLHHLHHLKSQPFWPYTELHWPIIRPSLVYHWHSLASVWHFRIRGPPLPRHLATFTSFLDHFPIIQMFSVELHTDIFQRHNTMSVYCQSIWHQLWNVWYDESIFLFPFLPHKRPPRRERGSSSVVVHWPTHK